MMRARFVGRQVGQSVGRVGSLVVGVLSCACCVLTLVVGGCGKLAGGVVGCGRGVC